MKRHKLFIALICASTVMGCMSPASRGAWGAPDSVPALDVPPIASDAAGRCFGRDTTPAVIETVTEQIIVQPAVLNSDGMMLSPAVFRTITHQKIMRERREVEFETPCPHQMTPQFIASVQRALKARGYYRGNISGVIDARTSRAIQAFQRQDGYDSQILTLAAARSLGLIAESRDVLDADQGL